MNLIKILSGWIVALITNIIGLILVVSLLWYSTNLYRSGNHPSERPLLGSEILTISGNQVHGADITITIGTSEDK